MCTRFFSKTKKYKINDSHASVPQNGFGRGKSPVTRPHSFLPPGVTNDDEREPETNDTKLNENEVKPTTEDVKTTTEEKIEDHKTVEDKIEDNKTIEENDIGDHKTIEVDSITPQYEIEVEEAETTGEVNKTVEDKIEPPVEIAQAVQNETDEETFDEKSETLGDGHNDISTEPIYDTQSEEGATEDVSEIHETSINDEPTEIPVEGERRPGVIPLPVTYDEDSVDEIEKYPKASEDDKIIREAIERSEFLNKILKGDLLKQVVDAMYNREIIKGETIIKEGETGAHMYVSGTGSFEVSVEGKGVVNTFDDVRVFGEMAILYNNKRNATIRALQPGRVWVLDRTVYQKLMVRFNIKEQEEILTFLKNVPRLNKVGAASLQKVSNLLKVQYYGPGVVIIRQGEKGDKFYLIRAGSVTITREGEGVVAKRGKGEYFGELGLLKDDVRQATVTADSPGGVECLELKGKDFIAHFGELGEEGLNTTPMQKRKDSKVVHEHQDIELKDLKIITTLGVGGFGRVELVQHKAKNKIFALKYLKKIDMLEQNQQEHVYNERNLQLDCRSKFIIRLYRSYKDNKYIYFLMEPCLGGDLWTLLQRQKSRRFDEKDARFIAACVLEAFTYLHERDIVYRDLKPENILIDEHGYVKLTDFGFAKKLGSRGRTFTFAGTPEYVAPEIILSRGHDKAVDYWAFGIFIFELLTGRTPFRTNDVSHMRTYNKILTGIDNVDFPSYVSRSARNIIEKLCKAIPTERLGCQRKGVKDIKDHRWFLGFDWAKLNQGKMSAPFKPKLRSKIDTRYFEAFRKDTDVPPDETSGWDSNF